MTQRALSSHVRGMLLHCGSNYNSLHCILRLKHPPESRMWPDRVTASFWSRAMVLALYAVWRSEGSFPKKIDQFYANGTQWLGHVTHRECPELKLATGSAWPCPALGMRHGTRPARRRLFKQGSFGRLSDGECDEARNWKPLCWRSITTWTT